MSKKNSSSLRCQLVTVPLYTDERGSLCFAESTQLPFPIERVFWIYDVPDGKTRGGHAHATCAEIVFPVSGSFDIWVDDGTNEQTYHLSSPQEGILIPPCVWCELRNFSPNTICVVLASEAYNSEGYINEYTSFKNAKNS